MKKRPALYMISAAILMIVLAGCTATLGPAVSLRNAEIRTNWHDSAGTSVICQNKQTTIQYQFDVHGVIGNAWQEVGQIKETYQGLIQGGQPLTRSFSLSDSSVSRDGNTLAVTRRYGASVLPRSVDGANDLESSAIVVVPIDPVTPTAENGKTHLAVEVRDNAGFLIGRLTHTFDVYGGCEGR